MKIRPFEPGDYETLARIFADSVRSIPTGDYSCEQLEVWAAAFSDLGGWLIERPGRIVLIAEEISGPIGFVTFEPDGHIDCIYVHPHFQRQGVASALLDQIETRAAGPQLERIFTEASITARPFFEYAGFRVIAPQTVIRDGLEFKNYRMEKLLRDRTQIA